jgi:hypothetical protein
MLSVEQMELMPDLAKSALHFEYKSVASGCFVCMIPALACGRSAYADCDVDLVDSLLVTGEFYQSESISVNRSSAANILYSSRDSANRKDAKIAKEAT